MTDLIKIKTLAEIQLGEFLRFEDRDDKGKFSYVGKVVNIIKSENMVEIKPFQEAGLFGYIIDDKTNLFKDEKPVGWDKFEKDPDAYFQKQRDKVEEQNQLKLTLKQSVFAFVKDNPAFDNEKLMKKCKKEIEGDEKLIEMFVKVALMQKNRGTKNDPA